MLMLRLVLSYIYNILSSRRKQERVKFVDKKMPLQKVA